MPTTLKIRDQTLDGGTLNELSLEFLTETISVRELIRSRVYQEVQDYNLGRRTNEPFRGLVQPNRHEVALNARDADAKHLRIDWTRQFERAADAFESGKILILIDDRQVESLDQSITIRPGTAITFLRLTLLVGG